MRRKLRRKKDRPSSIRVCFDRQDDPSQHRSMVFGSPNTINLIVFIITKISVVISHWLIVISSREEKVSIGSSEMPNMGFTNILYNYYSIRIIFDIILRYLLRITNNFYPEYVALPRFLCKKLGILLSEQVFFRGVRALHRIMC